jgi:hypothetical protein
MRVAGLVDPTNLDLVAPFEHARADALAAHSYWDLRRGIYRGNRGRTDQFGNRAIADSEIQDHVSLDAIPPAQRAAAAMLLSSHPDAPRAFNGILGAEPTRVGMMIDLFNRPDVALGLKSAPRGVRTTLNQFMNRLSAAAQQVVPHRVDDVPKF